MTLKPYRPTTLKNIQLSEPLRASSCAVPTLSPRVAGTILWSFTFASLHREVLQQHSSVDS